MKSISIFWLLAFFACSLHAQIHFEGKWSPSDTTQIAKITTKDRAWYKGYLTTLNDSILVFKTKTGENYTFIAAEVDTIRFLPSQSLKNNFPHFPINQRLLSIPTAYGLKAGEFEYRNTMLFQNSVQYGLSDRFSLGGGAFFFFPLIYTAWGNMKVNTVVSQKQHIAFGAIVGRASIYGDDEPNDVFNYGMTYGVLSQKTKNGFFNLFAGRIMVSEEIYDSDDFSKWMLNIGYSRIINAKTRINIELGNYLSFKTPGLSLSINTLFPRSSWDFGVGFLPIERNYFAPILLISKTVRWQNSSRIEY